MIDHTRCPHENTKSERAKCRARQRQQYNVGADESIPESPIVLGDRLTSDASRPGLWVVLRRDDGSLNAGYIVACDGSSVLLNVGSGVERFTWSDVALFLD